MLRAQTVTPDNVVSIMNDYVGAHVKMDQNAGRFWISSGKKNGNHRFLYHGSKNVQNITSNVVFIINDGTKRHFFCNTTPDFALGSRPFYGSEEAVFRPYDSIRYVEDTIEIRWEKISVFNITMRFVMEEPSSVYDDGADILMEFEYEQVPNRPLGTLDIFLMLDGDNGAAELAGTGGGGDASSIMTDRGYFPYYSAGRLFRLDVGLDTIPEFYHVGNFEYNGQDINNLLSVHRLRGYSNGGVKLDPPRLMSVGNWKEYRSLALNPYASNTVGDVATAMQWENMQGSGIIRTAFGTNNAAGNNIYHCRDRGLFAEIRTVRLIKQQERGGPFIPSKKILVEMWVTNTTNIEVFHPTVKLITPIKTYPVGTERLTLDPSTPAVQRKVDGLNYRRTQKFAWYLNLDENPNVSPEDTLAMLEFEFKKRDDFEFEPFADACTPYITILPFEPPPTDTLPPVIERISYSRTTAPVWGVNIFDRHPNFDYDTGIDSIEIVRNLGNRFKVSLGADPVEPFRRCDVSETVDMIATIDVADTAKEGFLLFRAWDCNGNSAVDSIIYFPRPDIYPPTVSFRDSSGSWDADAYPCNATNRRVVILDSIHQFSESGDNGLGDIEVVSLQNFTNPVITDQRGGDEIRDFDWRTSLEFSVIDPLFDATAEIRILDYANNDTTLYFSYCTIHDFLPPLVNSTQQSELEWTVDASDKRDWDRGLFDIVEISNPGRNFEYLWPDGTYRDSIPDINKGAGSFGLNVRVVNKCDPAELILEVRDSYFDQDPENHRAFDTIRYEGIPDTLAPFVTIIPGFDGRTYFYDVEIKDIHYPNGEFFECDRGIETVTYTMTSNVRVRTPLRFINQHEATISFEIIDTLAIDRIDTICVTAIDSVGNENGDCSLWPSTPDGKSPIFIGRYDRATGAIVGTATDNRENDRGLGSVKLRSANNLDPAFVLPNLRGTPSQNVTINSIDPTAEIEGELVIQDLYGELLQSVETSLHTVVIPFRLPVVNIGITMPDVVDANTQFDVPIAAASDLNGDVTHTLEFEVETSGPAQPIVTGTPTVGLGSFSVANAGANRLRITYTIPDAVTVPVGTTIGSIRFDAQMRSTAVLPFYFRVVEGSGRVNGGMDTTIVVRRVETDPLASELTLPAPLLRHAGDSLTYVNGECNRILGDNGSGKPTGLAILAIEPQPVSSARSGVTTVLRALPAEGAVAEWVNPEGQVVGRYELRAVEGDVARYTIPVPGESEPGLYFLRIHGSTGVDSRKVLIIE